MNIYILLQGPENFKARMLYRALVAHHKTAQCSQCRCYPKYGSMLVKAGFLEHIKIVAGLSFDRSDFLKIRRAKLIYTQRVSPEQHRIIFNDPMREEKTA